MKTKRFQVRYPYSKVWLVLWLLLFLPIGLVLLTRLEYSSNTQTIKWEYQGSRFWLHFWALFFFPITILLACLNGALTVADCTPETVLTV